MDRSNGRPGAATKQLEAVARDTGAQLLVIAGEDGAVVSRAGVANPVDEAALADFGGRAIGLWQHVVGGLGVAGAHTLRVFGTDGVEFAGRFFRFCDIPLVAIARSQHGPVDSAQLDRIQSGFTRILEAKDIRGMMSPALPESAGE